MTEKNKKENHKEIKEKLKTKIEYEKFKLERTEKKLNLSSQSFLNYPEILVVVIIFLISQNIVKGELSKYMLQLSIGVIIILSSISILEGLIWLIKRKENTKKVEKEITKLYKELLKEEN